MEITFGEYFPYVHHAARLPDAIASGLEAKRHKVAIVGGGPTGLAMALDLANHGIASVVLEADDTVCSGSRAGAFTRRTLEILERLGIIDEVMRTGHGWSTGWTYYRDKEVFRLEMPNDASQKYPPAISHLQNYIEHVMVERAAATGLVEIRWQSQVTGIKVSADGVRLDVTTPEGRYALDADWVVACDGARSGVRSLMDLRMQGTRYEGRYVIIDVRIDTEGLPVGRRCWFDPPSKPGGTLLMYKKPGGMLRFDYQLGEDEDENEAMKPEKVFGAVDNHLKMLGIERKWEPVWMSLYRASALTLDSYLHGRVLFAGDAAHLIPIFGVRGMNSALDDTHNLGWKLAYVVKGLATRELLETYSAERVYAARENHRFAMKGAEFMSPPSKPFRLMRDAVLSLSEKHPWFTSLMNPRQHSAIPLVNSALNAFAERSAAFEAGPAPGIILPECSVTSGGVATHITSLLGHQFTLFVFGETAQVPPGVAASAAALAKRVPLDVRAIARADDHTGKLFPMYGAQPGTAYLVRPDGHVMARWLSLAPEELAAALPPMFASPPNALQGSPA
ncbi:MAG: FAD-dependent monooxygenase [Proteobacteria bacterium]|nr:FAD-dependent monooxygenase [Pseudomonadota bacterium]